MEKFIVRLVDAAGDPITALRVPRSTTLGQLVRFVTGKRPDYKEGEFGFGVGSRDYPAEATIGDVAEREGIDLAEGITLTARPRQADEPKKKKEVAVGGKEPVSEGGDYWRQEMRKTLTAALTGRSSPISEETAGEEEEDADKEPSGECEPVRPVEGAPAAEERDEEPAGLRLSERAPATRGVEEFALDDDRAGGTGDAGGQAEIPEVSPWSDADEKLFTSAADEVAREISPVSMEAITDGEQEKDAAASLVFDEKKEPEAVDRQAIEDLEQALEDLAVKADSQVDRAPPPGMMRDRVRLEDSGVDRAPPPPMARPQAAAPAPPPAPPPPPSPCPAPAPVAAGPGSFRDIPADAYRVATGSSAPAGGISPPEPEPVDEKSVLGSPQPVPPPRPAPAAGAGVGGLVAGDERARKAEADTVVIGAAPASSTPVPSTARRARVSTGAAPVMAPEEKPKADEAITRRATVRHFKQMNPLRVFPLAVFFSERRIVMKPTEDVVQTEAKREIRVTEKDPCVEIVPHFPGCLVAPERIRLNVKGRETQAVFAVTPLAEGIFETARVDIYHRGEKIEEIHTPTRVVKQTAARVAVAAGFVGPVLSAFFDILQLEQGSEESNPIAWGVRRLVDLAGGWTALGLAFGGASLFAALVFYLMRRPKKGDPVTSMMAVDEWVEAPPA